MEKDYKMKLRNKDIIIDKLEKLYRSIFTKNVPNIYPFTVLYKSTSFTAIDVKSWIDIIKRDGFESCNILLIMKLSNMMWKKLSKM